MKKKYGILAGCTIVFMIISFELKKQFEQYNLFIPRDEIQWSNLIQAWVPFLIIGLLLPCLCFLPLFKDRYLIMRNGSNKVLIAVLFMAYIICIFYQGVTASTVFNFVFYLLIVGLGEEFVFRGILYNLLRLQSYRSAVIISGALWGMMHYAPRMMLNGFLGGILVGWLFILSYEYGCSLLVPVLIHAIWDTKIPTFIRILIPIMITLYFIVGKTKKDKGLSYEI